MSNEPKKELLSSNHSSSQAISDSKISNSKQALSQANEQVDQLVRLHSDLLADQASAVSAFRGLPLDHQQLLWQESEQLLQAKKLTSSQQHSLLQAMIGVPWPKLNLSLFDAPVVTKQVLQDLLKAAGEHLLELDISGCTELHPSILESIQGCSQLQRLTMNHQPKWQILTISSFPALTHLEMNHATALLQLSFRQLPALQQLKLRGCRSLVTLTNAVSNSLSVSTTVDDLPQLQDLDIRDCKRLIKIQLLTKQLESLQCQWEGGDPTALINWMWFLCQQNKVDTTFLKQINLVSAVGESVLDLSSAISNRLTRDIGFFLLRANVPITRLMVLPQPNITIKTPAADDKATLSQENKAAGVDYYSKMKMLLVGDSYVGKTRLMRKFARDLTTQPLSGVDFTVSTKMILGHPVKFLIWYTSGSHRLRTIIAPYHYSDANVFFLCFDLTNKKSFENIRFWIEECVECYAKKGIPKLLLGLKADLKKNRAIDYEKAQALADEYSMPYFECSVETGVNVEEAFLSAALLAISRGEHSRSEESINEDRLRWEVTQALCHMPNNGSEPSPSIIPKKVKQACLRFAGDNLNFVRELLKVLACNHTLLSININPYLLSKADGAAIEKLLIRDRQLVADTKQISLPNLLPLPANKVAFFQPAPCSQLVETKGTKQNVGIEIELTNLSSKEHHEDKARGDCVPLAQPSTQHDDASLVSNSSHQSTINSLSDKRREDGTDLALDGGQNNIVPDEGQSCAASH